MRHDWKQTDLMQELEVGSRQTIISWEKAERVPRLVELAIYALDQLPAARQKTGYEKQYDGKTISNRHFEARKAAQRKSVL